MNSVTVGVSKVWHELVNYVGNGWNQFWYVPRTAVNLRLLTRLASAAALVWLGLLSVDLTSMFAASGWLSAESVHQVLTDGDFTRAVPGFSHLFWIDSAPALWAAHAAAMIVVALAVAGKAPRITTSATWLIVLAYIHRAPMVTGAFEVVLAMLLCYLAIGSLGVDYRDADAPSWVANVITRLVQTHVCGLYGLIVASKLGTPVWWTGDASWYLLSDAQHRLVELRFLTSKPLLMNAITHFWLLVEMAFPVLVWNRQLRPLMLALATLVWVWTAVTTGLIGYAFLMLSANVAFMDGGEKPT